MARRKTRQEPHVRLYRHEHECAAYQSLSTDARTLLIEFRALYSGGENRLFMSLREMRRRMGGVGQKRAQNARDELLDTGFVRLLTPGSFKRKSRHAAEYALTHIPLEDRDGATAPKDFMKWRKNTVAEMNTDSSCHGYRGSDKKPQKLTGASQNGYRQATEAKHHGSQNEFTDRLPSEALFILAAMRVQNCGELQFKLILGAVLVAMETNA